MTLSAAPQIHCRPLKSIDNASSSSVKGWQRLFLSDRKPTLARTIASTLSRPGRRRGRLRVTRTPSPITNSLHRPR